MYAAPPPPAWGSGDGGGNGASYAMEQPPYGGGAAGAGGLMEDDEGAELERQLAIALDDAAANASRLAATPASDEPAARRLTAAVQASLAAARASMRDLELFAEEQDTCVLSSESFFSPNRMPLSVVARRLFEPPRSRFLSLSLFYLSQKKNSQQSNNINRPEQTATVASKLREGKAKYEAAVAAFRAAAAAAKRNVSGGAAAAAATATAAATAAVGSLPPSSRASSASQRP